MKPTALLLTMLVPAVVSAQQKPTTGYAPVNGLKMYYEVHGSGDPGRPFDALAAGLVSEHSRGDKMAIELFIAGVRGWEAYPRRRLDDGKLVEYVA